MHIENYRLDSIKMENPYLRLGTDVSTLEQSISTVGLIAPLIINESGVLLAGARRWQALKNLGKEEAPVIIVEKDSLHQELISIDENLVRKSLTDPEMEKHLSRAKQIYRVLAGEDESFKQSLIEKRKKRLSEIAMEGDSQAIDDEEEVDLDTLATEEFAEEVSVKSGLSQKQIMKAMEREEKSSEALKTARNNGLVNVSQTNELIRLDAEDQEKLINHVGERTVSELRKIVKDAKTIGVDEALIKHEKQPHMREYNEILKSLKKAYKFADALSLEGVEISGPIRGEVEKYWTEFSRVMPKLLGEYESSASFSPEYLQDGSTDFTEGNFTN